MRATDARAARVALGSFVSHRNVNPEETLLNIELEEFESQRSLAVDTRRLRVHVRMVDTDCNRNYVRIYFHVAADFNRKVLKRAVVRNYNR